MSMKNKKRSRADGAMTPEELNKAIEEYKARRAQRAGAAAPAASEDGDDVPPSQNPDPIAKSQPAVADGDDTGSTVIAASGQDGDDLENRVQAVKANRDRRDAEGDPKDMNGAMGVIARQDGDIDLLLGIIEIFASAYISTQLSNAILFAVLIVVLLVKPSGLLGKYVPEKV